MYSIRRLTILFELVDFLPFSKQANNYDTVYRNNQYRLYLIISRGDLDKPLVKTQDDG